VEGDNRGHLEAARDFVDCIILGNLEDVHDALEMFLGRVEGKAICENREDEGMEDASPVSVVEATNQVTKDAKTSDGGTGTVSHDGGVMSPAEFVMDRRHVVGHTDTHRKRTANSSSESEISGTARGARFGGCSVCPYNRLYKLACRLFKRPHTQSTLRRRRSEKIEQPDC